MCSSLIISQLLMQLGAGFLRSDDWTDIMTHQREGVAQLPNCWQDSHGCGNGCPIAVAHEDNTGCVNVFCMFWETHIDNMNRTVCHRIFAVHANGTISMPSDADNGADFSSLTDSDLSDAGGPDSKAFFASVQSVPSSYADLDALSTVTPLGDGSLNTNISAPVAADMTDTTSFDAITTLDRGATALVTANTACTADTTTTSSPSTAVETRAIMGPI